MELYKGTNSYKEHDTAKGIYITLESRSSRVTLDPNDLRRTPSIIESYSCRGPLQFRVPCDRCETEICEAWITRTIYEHISLKLTNERDVQNEMIAHTG